jgi:hypothetical protein
MESRKQKADAALTVVFCSEYSPWRRTYAGDVRSRIALPEFTARSASHAFISASRGTFRDLEERAV